MAAVSQLSTQSTVHIIYCMNYNDNLNYCLPHKCIIVVQHLVFHTSIEKLSAALKKRKSTLKQNVLWFSCDLGLYY